MEQENITPYERNKGMRVKEEQKKIYQIEGFSIYTGNTQRKTIKSIITYNLRSDFKAFSKGASFSDKEIVCELPFIENVKQIGMSRITHNIFIAQRVLKRNTIFRFHRG